jgi:predicted ATPase
MERLIRIVIKIINLLAEENLSVADASYVLQIVQMDAIEQGTSPKLREFKKGSLAGSMGERVKTSRYSTG